MNKARISEGDRKSFTVFRAILAPCKTEFIDGKRLKPCIRVFIISFTKMREVKAW